MRGFAQTCEAVAATTKKKEKVRLVAEYLRAAPLEEAACAAVFFTGFAFPRNRNINLSVGGALLWDAVARVTGATPEQIQAAYRRHGDLGSAAAELSAEQQQSSELTVCGVSEKFDEIAARRGQDHKAAAVAELLQHMDALEAKYLIKIITGDLRIGLKESLVEEAIALAFGADPALVRRANMLLGDIAATVRLAAKGTLHEAKLEPFQPVGFMLATPAAISEEIADSFPSGVFVEDKYDGIRAQAHKRGERVEIFSRTLSRVTEFPELIAPLAALPGDFVLDGEIVPWRGERALPFNEFQKRLGRKRDQMDLFREEEIPVLFIAFDLIYRDGESVLDQPLAVRRDQLRELLAASAPQVRMIDWIRCDSKEQISLAFANAVQRGNEGIMAKGPESPYTPGRRGRYWFKLKRAPATLDVVVTAVEYGHGKRHHVLSDYTFAVRSGERLLNIGKAYSGLTDAEIAQLTPYFIEHTTEDQGFRRIVEPTVVLEVAFDVIQRSDRHSSGYALRFPRILRLRPDKSTGEIDTMERVQQILERQRQSDK